MVFLDETSVNTGMTKLHGRALKGVRVVDYAPDVRFESTSILSSVNQEGECVPNGALNVDMYISKLLLPTLKTGDIVIMDNLSSHKVSGVEELINKAGASLLYLPPYSPDFNPIEQM